MKIALDIGHANGTGASGHGLQEHTVAAKITEYINELLKKAEYSSDIIDFPTRSNSGDLNETIRKANNGGYKLGVSIHCDCSDNSSAKGGHVCYLTKNGEKLAKLIAKPLSELLPGRSEKIVKRTNLAMLKQTKPVWVLVECGFISNSHDAQLMKNDPKSIAKCIVDGIIEYLK